MGCKNSRVCPLPMGLAVETQQNRNQKRNGGSLLAGLKNVFRRTNRVVPCCNNVTLDDVIDQPSTSYPRDETVNAEEFLFWQRFYAANSNDDIDSESDSDDDDVTQPSMSYPPGKVKRSSNIRGIAHPKDENMPAECVNKSYNNDIKTRPVGVAFEVFDPIAEEADIKVSRGSGALDITTNHVPAATAERDVSEKMPLQTRPITSMSCTRYAKEGVAFEIDFGDEEEKRKLKTLSKVTSIMATNGWSERDVIKEADDIWVASKVLAMNDNAKRSPDRQAKMRKAKLEMDLVTCTMPYEKLKGFYNILVMETKKDHSLLRQALFQAWKEKLREETERG